MADLDEVRTLIGGDQTATYLTDAEIDVWLGKGYSVFYTAYLSLLSLAANQSFLAYRVRTLNYEKDGATVARELAKRAEAMRLADEQEPAGGAAEQAHTPATAVEIMHNRYLREQ